MSRAEWKKAEPYEMVFWLKAEKDVTPWWRVMRRLRLELAIRYWEAKS